jgi:hypothetical protein
MNELYETILNKSLLVSNNILDDVLAAQESGNPKDAYAAGERLKVIASGVKDIVEAANMAVIYNDDNDQRQANL